MHGKVLTYDFRAPIVDSAKTWDIWLTATEPGTINLLAYSTILNPYYGGKLPPVEEPGHPAIVGDYDGGLASLTLWRGSDMLWNWHAGQMMAGMQSFAFDGAAIALRLVATPETAPEPGSLIALLTVYAAWLGLWGSAAPGAAVRPRLSVLTLGRIVLSCKPTMVGGNHAPTRFPRASMPLISRQ